MKSSTKFGTCAVVAGCFATSLLWSQAASAQAATDPYGDFSARSFPAHASPDSVAPPSASDGTRVRDVRSDTPIVTYAYGASGAPKGTMGAQGYGLGLVASGQNATVGGGTTVWGAPIERLTLVVDAQRNVWGNFSPSVAAVVHLLGERGHGWSLGGLGKFKIDGFASGPHKDEVESELELGALLSFADFGWHLDMNAIAGRGLGDDGETDSEARFRFGRDLGYSFRLGLDSQGRVRMGGPKYLPNGKIWDFAAGGQLMFGDEHLFAVLTAGPATMGLLSPNLGFTSVLGIGGTT